MKRLVCDRCDFEIAYKEDINLALEGQDAWEMACSARDEEPRGVFPCKNYRHCHGEMQVVTVRGGLLGRLRQKANP